MGRVALTGPSDSDLDPNDVYDNDDDQNVTPPPQTSQLPTPPSDSPKPDTPSKSSSSDDEPEVPGALNPEGGELTDLLGAPRKAGELWKTRGH